MIVHLNGALLDESQAHISPFDRGFLFGDGVYDGVRTHGTRIIGLRQHVARLADGLNETGITTFDPRRLSAITAELVHACGLEEAFVYWQITRGTPPVGAPRRARVPSHGTPPTVFGFATPVEPLESWKQPDVRRVRLQHDTRWMRGHIKSISLLGNVLAAMAADAEGCDDAILHRDGLVTEGTATNVFLSINGRMVTPSLDSVPMLAGVTRALILDEDPSIEQRAVTLEELRAADEIMLVGTRSMVAAVIEVDGRPVGGPGAARQGAGPASRALLATLRRAIERDLALTPH